MPVKLIASGIAAVIISIIAIVFWPLVGVQAGHVGVVVLFGQVQEVVLQPGLHVVNPMAHVIDMDVRQYPLSIDGEVGTKDLQSVHGKVVVNYRVSPETAGKLYAQFGPKYWDIIITPAVQDRMKATTPHYTAEELVTKRADVSKQIKSAVIEAVRGRSGGFLVVDDVVVADFGFAKSFKDAIENKQVAEQLAFKAERDLQRIKIEAEQQIATAKASAESFRLQSLQLTPAMIQMEAIKKWNGKLPEYVGSGAPMPFITVK
jgi:prohibitin 2